MRIPVWSSSSTPNVHRHDYRKTLAYCEREVAEGRARPILLSDITKGIHLLPSEEIARKSRTEHRGSPEAHGCLTANETLLSAEHSGVMAEDVHEAIYKLSCEYDDHLAKHEAERRKGLPRACAVIAARVKTILSDPVDGRKELIRMVVQA